MAWENRYGTFLALLDTSCVKATHRSMCYPAVQKQRGRPPPRHICGWVVMLTHIADWHPRNPGQLPGNEVLWNAWQAVHLGVLPKEAGQATMSAVLGGL